MEVDQSQVKGGRSVPFGSRDRSLTVAALTVALAFLSGCGVPGEPLPPLLEIPAPVQDLSAVQVGAEAQITWSPPRLTTEGTNARRLDRIEIHGVFLPEGAALRNFPEQARLLAVVRKLSVPDAPDTPVGEDRMAYALPLEASQIGATAFFAVKTVNDRGRDAGFSNVVSVRIADLPEPPSSLQAVVTEKSVRLRWEPSARSVFGGTARAVDGYQVLRKEAGSAEPEQVIGTTPSPDYEDAAFEFEHRYVYTVRAFVKQDDQVAVTPPSAPAEIAAADRFPPAPPENVRAIATPGAIELVWSPNSEADLAGYNLYRKEGGAYAKINSELLRIPVFRDAAVRPGVQYSYRVHAADLRGNQGGPSETVSIEAE